MTTDELYQTLVDGISQQRKQVKSRNSLHPQQ